MDARLRNVARESGDPEARAQLLLERLRSGEFSQERLELAAYLGDTCCRLAVEASQVDCDPSEREGFRRWAKLFHVSDKEIAVRGALALAGEFQARLGWPMQDELKLFTKWLSDPTSAVADARRELLEQDSPELEEEWGAIRGLGDGLLKLVALEDRLTISEVLRAVLIEADVNLVWAQGTEAATPIHALRRGLIPWAMGLDQDEYEAVGD